MPHFYESYLADEISVYSHVYMYLGSEERTMCFGSGYLRLTYNIFYLRSFLHHKSACIVGVSGH